MTSQKRYRHHQDNNSSRFRDLPPRFKRQKSSTSPTPQSSSESQVTQTSSTSKSSQVSKTTKKTAEPPQETMSPVPVTPNPVVYIDTSGTQERVRTDIFQTPQPVAPGAVWAWPVSTDSITVLSEVDNRVTRINSPVSHVALGTRFGYTTTSPPMSPWPAGGVVNITQPQAISSNSVWSPPMQSNPLKSPNLLSPPGFYNNENRAPHGMPQLSPGNQWNKMTFAAMQNQHLPSTSTQNFASSSIPIKSSGKPRSNPEIKKNGVKRDVDYSDPDIRTIEMLRELERVADEKEAENDDFGADRKSLVSHHLRMLMCAVDRYTEGLEDEIALTSRSDEVSQVADSPASTPAPSPSPSKMWHQGQTNSVKNGASPVPSPAFWSVNSSPEWARESIVSPNDVRQFSSPSPIKLEFPSPQPSPSGKGQATQIVKEAPAWNLWSSPSFDFRGVLTHQGSN